MNHQSYEFLTERARESEAEADAATLDNVRERHLTAAATWRGLADQARRVAEERAKVEREKAAAREAEANLPR